MKIWIDADAAPRDAKEIIFRAARRLNITTILVANSSVPLPLNAPSVSAVTVSEGANIADRYIADHAEAFDIAVTADIPLAAALVEKQVFVIDPRGEEYSPQNIASRLSVRNFMDDLRGAGETIRGARPYDERNKKEFAAAFDRCLARARKADERKARDNSAAQTDSLPDLPPG
ncbi:MAG: YaiI/YqxD family protein [Pirellulales bacterium]